MASGGEIRLAIGLASGYSAAKMSTLFNGKLGNVDPGDKPALMEFAQAGVDAAASIEATHSDSLIPLGDIPVNPNLWGDNPAGRRVLIVGSFSIGDDDIFQTRYLELPDAITFQELSEWLANEAYRMLNDSPDQFKGLIEGEPPEVNVNILFAERRF